MSSGERQDSGIAAITAQLAQTQSLIQNLLSEIRESSVSQAALKAELKQLRYNVQVLSNIIRGGDGNNRSLISEVEVLKHADHHLDKRMTAILGELEEQIDEMANALSASTDRLQAKLEEHRKELETKLETADIKRREDEAQKMQLQLADKQDLRLDRRQRLQTYSTIAIAIISLIGSIAALLLKS